MRRRPRFSTDSQETAPFLTGGRNHDLVSSLQVFSVLRACVQTAILGQAANQERRSRNNAQKNGTGPQRRPSHHGGEAVSSSAPYHDVLDRDVAPGRFDFGRGGVDARPDESSGGNHQEDVRLRQGPGKRGQPDRLRRTPGRRRGETRRHRQGIRDRRPRLRRRAAGRVAFTDSNAVRRLPASRHRVFLRQPVLYGQQSALHFRSS